MARKMGIPRGSRITILAATLISAGFCLAGPRANHNQTALDRYVFAPDPNYDYKLVNTVKSQGATSYVLNMISQQWRTTAEVDRPIWQHWLTIIVPDKVETSTGLLLLSGGSNRGNPPKSTAMPFVTLAVNTHSVVAELRMVPNEPLTFKDETKARSEDAIIAYTWDKYLRTGDESWPLRLPMTKGAVRAMDTITDFCGSPERGKVPVTKFVVAGGSKRGWTAWTTAAVDDRVIAIAPFVIDVLNNEKCMEHQFRSYGFWAPAIKDYTDMHIMDWAGTPRYKALMKIEDPYSYRGRLTMPKFIVNSTGDQYFLPDSSQFYFDGLKGDKLLRYVPNTRHDLEKSDAPFTLMAFYEMILKGTLLPKYSWKFEKDGSIAVHTKDKPTEVKVWQATNPKARDFRLDSIGPAYKSSPLGPQKEGVYVARVPKPEQGWTAFFVELTYPSGEQNPVKVTTGVRVIPDTLPFPAPKKKSR